MNYLKQVPTPHWDSINSGLESCPTKYIQETYGDPAPTKTTNCYDGHLNTWWEQRIRTIDVGPFRATGFKPFLLRLKVANEEVKVRYPDLYDLMGSAGGLCVRKVRGGSNWSNHSFGMAIDIKLGGVLDAFKDGYTQQGLITLYSVYKKYMLFWGAEWNNRGREDSMHFEASRQLVEYWEKFGYLKK